MFNKPMYSFLNNLKNSEEEHSHCLIQVSIIQPHRDRPWDASDGVSKPWRCPRIAPDRPAPCLLPDATQGRSLWVIINEIWHQLILR